MPTLRLLPELEDALRHIPGVRAASVVTGPDAVPTEVHVLASPGKPAKQVVRDVQSLALASFDLDIDHRIVSVVQIGDDEEVAAATGGETSDGRSPAETSQRPAISAIMVRTSGQQAEATVTVTYGDAVFEGKATGPAAGSHRGRLVAQATLKALDELLGTAVEVESTSVTVIGMREVVVTILTVMTPRIGEQIVTGSALVRGDDADAVARSVLAGLNRRLTG